MDKLDFRKRDRAFYAGTPGQWHHLDVPPMPFLMIDGRGDPNGPAYARALSALYPLAYALKFMAKARGADFVVPPQEALWWADDPNAFTRGDRAAWQWTAMLRLPDNLTPDDVDTARATCRAKLAKKPDADPAALDEVRLATLAEGACLQTLHIGPYTEEGPILALLHDTVMPAEGLTFNGAHHEIYLGDPRRAAPEKLKTLLRQPVHPA